ncbi:MAG: RNA polymerase sigma factor [Bacteroidia bacterium]
MDKASLYEIINGCKNNDRNSQRLLFEFYSKKMMGVCLRYSPNYETARDMVQDGFVKVYTKISGFKSESSVETWMTRIFINTCLTNISKAENKNIFLDINDPIVEHKAHLNIEVEATIEEVMKNLPLTKIFDYINQLPEKYRLVLNMYSIDGFSHQQISDSLGIQVGSSKSRLSRARLMLIDLIKQKEKIN